MSDSQLALAAALTVLALVAVAARQVVGLRDARPAPRWLTVLAAVLVVAFLVAMALRLRPAL
jgi:hypothetical protein